MDLANLSKTKLFQIRRILSGGVGDTSISRTELITYLTDNFSEFAIENAAISTLHTPQPTTERATPTPAAPPAPPAPPSPPAPPAQPTPADNIEKLALELVQALKEQKAASVPQAPIIDEAQIKTLVKDTLHELWGTTLPTILITPDNVPKTTHSAFKPVCARVLLGLPVLLTGPAGCGKTHLAEQVAEELKLEFGMLSCSEGMSESHLLGYLLPTKTGSIEYTPSVFVRLYSEGGLMLLDELDAADPNTLLVLNSALANKKLFVPQAGRTFAMHEDFRIVATANTFGVGATGIYAGRNRLDAATLDRFRAGIVAMDYDTGLESLLVPDNMQLHLWARNVRIDIKTRGLKHVMSTRTLTAFDRLMKAGESFQSIQDTYYLDWTEQERGL